MNRDLIFTAYSDLAKAALPPEKLEQWAREGPDLHVVAQDTSGTIVARCSIWFRATPPLENECPGVIGHFEADDRDSGTTVLENASQRLAGEGCTCAIGPMNGNTWQKYRLVIDPGIEPPFFLEPQNAELDVAAFRGAGFEEFALYSSAKVLLPAPADPRLEPARERLANNGVKIRELNVENFEQELREIHALSLEAFRHNLLYTDLTWSDFQHEYRPVQQILDPRFCLMAECDGMLVGFLFALPDLGGLPDRLVAKTLACDSAREFAGLGAVLVEELHRRAEAAGYRQVIHALEFEGNRSRNLSRRYGSTIRRYALFRRGLGS